jgi:HlyD family secretion protein
MKIKKRKIIIGLVILILVGFVVSKVFIKNNTANFTEEKVVRGTIVQEVSETGTVKKGEEINLSFPAGGKIEKIYVQAGTSVKSGDVLAKLNVGQLNIQYAEAQASLEVAKAQLQIAQTSLANYQTDFLAQRQNLTNVNAAAQENLDSAYEDALNTLDDAYLKIYNALNTVKTIQATYFYKGDQEGVMVTSNKDLIENSLNSAKSAITIAKISSKNEDIETTLSVMKKSLQDTSLALTIIRQTCDQSSYKDAVSSTDKTSLDTHRININTVLTNTINAQQVISSAKITNETNVNATENKVSAAEGNLKKAGDDISLYQAQQKQTEAQVNLLRQQISDASIVAPTDGQVAAVNKQEGEITQASQSVISFISAGPFQIETNIYEEDVVKIKIGDPVDINLTAFSGQTFSGKIISINPAEKLVDGVVYYEVKIDFPSAPEETKPGMTADITIKTAQKDNVLILPESAITEKNGQAFVQIKKDNKLEDKEVQVGLKGGEGQVEIVSGLQEGDLVAVPK